MLAAEPGSTKMPSVDDSRRCAARISSSVTASIRPPDSSRAASAWRHEAGLPIRMAVAMVSGSSTGWPSTIGAAPAAWKPHICGVRVATGASSSPPSPGVAVAYSRVALPVGRDVAGVADRQHVDVGRVAERVDDLERRRLLALDAGRVDRVDQLDGVGLGELAGHGEAVVEVALDLDQGRAVRDGLAQLAHRDLAVGHEHGTRHPGLGRVGGRAGTGVAGARADDRLGAVALRPPRSRSSCRGP